MSYTQANGIRFNYEIAGSGERLLFISGTGGDLRNRPNVFDGPLLSEVSEESGFEVLSYDQRGLGQTEKPDGRYTMADYADDAAALLEASGWGPVPVMGASFGGMVARQLELADTRRTPQWQVDNPERWLKLCEIAGRAGRRDRDEEAGARQLQARAGRGTCRQPHTPKGTDFINAGADEDRQDIQRMFDEY